jgi:hypothetical protein
MSHDLPHVASVVGRVSESIVELPIVILGGMSTRLVMHLPVMIQTTHFLLPGEDLAISVEAGLAAARIS